MYAKWILELIINKSIEYRNATQNNEYYCDYYKLNKLLYIAHGISLAIYDTQLIDSNIYNSCLGAYVKEADEFFFDWAAYPITKDYEGFPIPPEYLEIIDLVVKYFGAMNKFQLSYICRQHPYFIEKLKRDDMKVIENEDIKNYFLSLGIKEILDEKYFCLKIKNNTDLKLILTKGISLE